MKILTLQAGHDDGTVRSYFGIWHEGKLWLVTAWLIDRATRKAVPERMILIDRGNYQQCDPGEIHHYTNIVLPIAVLDGDPQSVPRFEVRILPDQPVVDAGGLYELPFP